MATVICKLEVCPYLGGNPGDAVRFCQSQLVSIMPNGGCGIVAKPDGTVKPSMVEIIERKKQSNGSTSV